MGFVVDLWNSILTPGTTPALVKATHGSFVALVLMLVIMLFATRSLHFVALLVIALCLWAAITWFINEVETIKREQQRQKELEGTDANTDTGSTNATSTGAASNSGSAKLSEKKATEDSFKPVIN